MAVRVAGFRTVVRRKLPLAEGDATMDEHPKGALTFMLIYLVFLTLIWVNAYLRLWLKG